MKKLLLSAAFVLAAFVGVEAQTKAVYNISDFYAASETVATKTVNDLTITIADANNQFSVDGSKKTFGDYTCTTRLKSGGAASFDESGMPITRAFAIDVTGPGTVEIGMLSSSSSDNEGRYVGYTFVPESGELETGSTGLIPDTKTASLVSWNFTGNGNGKLYLYSQKSGINFYVVTYTPSNATSINTVAAAQEVVSSEYYNINGVRTNATTAGVYIKKDVLKDGSVKVTKTVVR